MDITAPLRMLKRRHKRGITRYWGEPNEICKQIIKDCYDDERNFFRTSAGHFGVFYARDFGMVVDGLLYLGYTKQVISTLDYAFGVFQKYGKITTTINEKGVPVNYFAYPSDSLPFLIRSVRKIRDHAKGANKKRYDELVHKYRAFLEHQAQVYASVVFDFQTGMVKRNVNLSTMKDHEWRKSDTYSNSMAGMLAIELDRLAWRNPLHDIPIGASIVKQRWVNYYFKQDATPNMIVSGDANVFPFYCDVVNDLELLNSAMGTIQKIGLDRPFPLKYTAKNYFKNKNWVSWLTPNYQGNTIWMHLGLCYLYVVEQYDPELLKVYLREYYNVIKNYGNFLEVFSPDGRIPYKNPVYLCDEGMLWAAGYLHLAQKYGIN